MPILDCPHCDYFIVVAGIDHPSGSINKAISERKKVIDRHIKYNHKDIKK